MDNLYLFISVLCIGFVFNACQQNNNQSAENTLTNSVVAPLVDAKFVCTDINEEETMPKSVVSFYLNGKVNALDTIAICDLISEADYERYNIPTA